MKTRIALILMILLALSFLAHSAVSAFLSPNLTLEREKLSGQEIILVETGAEGDAFHLGDSISYFVKIKYNPDEIEAIDEKVLDKTVILEPFKIRSLREKDYKIDRDTRAYLREYEIQLLDGATNELYNFPTITVRYKLKNSGWFDELIIPQPIFIGARVPDDVTGLDLKPLEGKIINVGRERLPWAFWSLGFFCGALVLTEIIRRVRKQKKEREDRRKGMEGLEDLFDNFMNLCQEAPKEKDPKNVLDRAHQILRALLIRKEGIDWLDPELDKVSQEIKQQVLSLLEKCQRAYQREALGQEDAKEVLDRLEKIFNFYTGKGEV